MKKIVIFNNLGADEIINITGFTQNEKDLKKEVKYLADILGSNISAKTLDLLIIKLKQRGYISD